MSRLSRRELVACVAAACKMLAQSRDTAPLRIAENASFDFSLLDDWLTPNDLFFVREHFPAPSVSAHGWKLAVAGAVAAPFEIDYEDLRQLPRKVLAVTLECAENPVGGGLASNAEWTGVSLAALLEKAQPRPGARFVRLTGADHDPAGDLYYARSIPLSKALHPDTIVAHRMGGEALPPAHGFPLRAIIPGWYGMDSVKWLRRVEVITEEDTSALMTRSYVRRVRSLLAGSRFEGAVTAMSVKAAFSRPLDGAILRSRHFILRGAAWAGENRVQKVELSTDGGQSWQSARFSSAGPGGPQPYAWVLWDYGWKIPGPGSYELAVRSTDDQGRQQPAERPVERLDDFELNAYQKVRVTVR